MTGGDILESVIETYRQLKTYTDSGNVTALIQAGSKSVEAGCSFATAFERMSKKESRFRYQWNSKGILSDLLAQDQDQDNINVICSNDEGIFKRYPLEGLSTCPSLPLAVADATGVSFGGVYYTASLLLDHIVPDGHWFFRRLQKHLELPLNSDAQDDDFHFLESHIKDEHVRLSVKKSDFSLKQMVVERPSSTIHFNWQNYTFDSDLDLRVFDQYRF